MFEPEPVVSEVIVQAEGEQAPARHSTRTSICAWQSFSPPGSLATDAASDTVKRPFSNLLAQTQSPLPSPDEYLQTIAWALQNKNRCPLRGSHDNRSRTWKICNRVSPRRAPMRAKVHWLSVCVHVSIISQSLNLSISPSGHYDTTSLLHYFMG
jgi:hypothetical protein